MQKLFEELGVLYKKQFGTDPGAIEKLPQSGGDRSYYRITGSTPCIATWSQNVQETATFLAFTKHFKASGCPVPEVYIVNDDATLYLQEDLGNQSLLDVLEKEVHTEPVLKLFQESLKELAHLQIQGHHQLDYEWCLTSKEFGKQAITADLLYFKYYFLDTLKIPYDKEQLIDDFEALSTYLTHVDHNYFMFRDFQSRNIMVKNNKVYFIDYQGGMRGALQYDVASLLWQAKAELPEQWKDELLSYYISCVETEIGRPVDRNRFVGQYNGYVLIRLLQVLGAYGFRGLFERKAHFLVSIPLALRNLKSFLTHKQVGIVLPELERLLSMVVSDDMVQRFESVRATEKTPLLVSIASFSYKINGIPPDDSGNGGGFVFDCRSIHNPGRYEPYKTLTGRDKEVRDFLEQQSQMPLFLNSVFNLVDIAVEDYIKRGFENLQISFGCTGGQHRSVYAADALARHLRNKFGVKIELSHKVQDAKNWINASVNQ